MGVVNMNLRQTHSIGERTREWIVAPAACPALKHHRIQLAGLSDAAYGFRFVRPQIAMSQALVCFSGRGMALLDGAWAEIREGMAYLTPPNVLHAYHAVKETRWGVCWVIYGEPGGGVKPMIAAHEPQLMRVDPRPLRSAITGLYQETVGGAESAMMYHWVELIHLLVTRMAQPWRSDDRLWRVWEAVDADLARPWTLKELAKLACLSGEHLRRLTQKQFGRSPLEQVTYLRMRKAAALLSSTPQKIETIGWAVGYQNAFAFSTAFKRCMGLSPAAYRLAGGSK
jgi:AraC-like DNA-binding protein